MDQDTTEEPGYDGEIRHLDVLEGRAFEAMRDYAEAMTAVLGRDLRDLGVFPDENGPKVFLGDELPEVTLGEGRWDRVWLAIGLGELPEDLELITLGQLRSAGVLKEISRCPARVRASRGRFRSALYEEARRQWSYLLGELQGDETRSGRVTVVGPPVVYIDHEGLNLKVQVTARYAIFPPHVTLEEAVGFDLDAKAVES